MTKESLDRKIKQNLYGKSQRVKILFPPGLGDIALREINDILANLWFPQRSVSECRLEKNSIEIDTIHLFAVIEIMMRSQCLTDIRLIISEKKVGGKYAFEKKCQEIDWNLYLNKNFSLKIKVTSIASRAFHETGLREILTTVLQPYVMEIVSGEENHETTILYADFYKNKVTISLSLAGQPLYKRGYREVLSKSAPLREDIAACCIYKFLQFARQIQPSFSPDNIIIPFAGTGTFAFEYLQHFFNFSAVLFGREYALQKMPFFRQENFNFLLKKAKESCTFDLKKENSLQVICIDSAKEALQNCLANIKNFKNAIEKNGFSFPNKLIDCKNENLFSMDIENFLTGKNIFLPLNPPYGIRLNNQSDTVKLYKDIANKLNVMFDSIKPDKQYLAGFILCPNEKTWAVFSKTLIDAKTNTYHFMQGGIDIRVCQFWYGLYNG